MPYPMIPGISFKEFREKLAEDYQCAYQCLGDGCWYLERTLPDGSKLQCPFEAVDGILLIPSAIRHICDLLHIPPADFGLSLG